MRDGSPDETLDTIKTSPSHVATAKSPFGKKSIPPTLGSKLAGLADIRSKLGWTETRAPPCPGASSLYISLSPGDVGLISLGS